MKSFKRSMVSPRSKRKESSGKPAEIFQRIFKKADSSSETRVAGLTKAVLMGTSALGIAAVAITIFQSVLPHSGLRNIDSLDAPILGQARHSINSSPLIGSPAHKNEKGNTVNGNDTLAGLFGQRSNNNQCSIAKNNLSESDMQVARIAWKYFENNYNSETGFVNSVHGYPSTTMWDTGSAIAAYIAAVDFGFITQKEFDDAMMKLMNSLQTMQMFNGVAPNKVYNTHTLDMVDYGNNVVEGGIGISILDLARLVSWMDTLQCMHPQYSHSASSALSRWDYTDLIKNEELYGMARDPLNKSIKVLQEGRLGYEQYAGKIFDRAGFSVETAKSYENQHRADTEIYGINIAYDNRDPRIYHANNYVVTESYAMDAMELGVDDINRELLKNIFDVQKKRWQETGIVTAISEDNIDREPWFLYNTIFTSGLPFNTITETGVQHNDLKTVSTKAALSMAVLFPEDEYSQVLLSTIGSAYEDDLGWYSGVYEKGGYNDVATANTNGVILSVLLYKKYDSISVHCDKCAQRLSIESDVINNEAEADRKDVSACESCGTEE